MSYAGKIEISGTQHPVAATLHGTCSTTASTVAKIVILSDFDELIAGTMISVKFVYSNTASNPTMNVNGTGALPIYKYGTTAPGTTAVDSWNANSVVNFVYDGNSWMMTDVNPDYSTVVANIIAQAKLAIYPVGSIYMSINSTSPASLFGGTWVQLQDTFLLAAGSTYTAGNTGGEATHTLIESEIPAHTHGSKSLTGTFGIRSDQNGSLIVAAESGIVKITQHGANNYRSVQDNSTRYDGDLVTINATHEHTSVGGGGAHNNMPPYLAVYMWKRIA